MPTGTTPTGKTKLFQTGWVTPINHIRLYTTAGAFVDGKSTSFSFNIGDYTISTSSDVVFNVSAGVNNVSYVEIGTLISGTFTAYYQKDLTSTYNFAISGTLTIDSFVISLSNSYIENYGKQLLWETGWTTQIDRAKLLTDTNTEVDTVSGVSFTVVSNSLTLTGTMTFDVSAPTSNVSKVQLANSTASIYTRTFTPYNYPTAGKFTVNSWVIS